MVGVLLADKDQNFTLFGYVGGDQGSKDSVGGQVEEVEVGFEEEEFIEQPPGEGEVHKPRIIEGEFRRDDD